MMGMILPRRLITPLTKVGIWGPGWPAEPDDFPDAQDGDAVAFAAQLEGEVFAGDTFEVVEVGSRVAMLIVFRAARG